MNASLIFNANSAEAHDEAVVLIDPEPLPRECLAEVLRAAFPRSLILSAAEISEIDPSCQTPVALTLLKIPAAPQAGAIGSSIAAIRRHLPRTPVVVIGPGCHDNLASEAIDAGARGILPSSEPLRVAIAAVRLVMAGGTYYPLRIDAGAAANEHLRIRMAAPLPPPDNAGACDSASPDEDPDEADAEHEAQVRFTSREIEVLAALQRGRSNKWIASQLNLSENTVKVHIRHIMRKLKATNRTQAVIYSQRIERLAVARQPERV